MLLIVAILTYFDKGKPVIANVNGRNYNSFNILFNSETILSIHNNKEYILGPEKKINSTSNTTWASDKMRPGSSWVLKWSNM